MLNLVSDFKLTSIAMTPEYQLDPIDRRILHELTKDARLPYTQLAKKLRVSNTLVHQRIKKLRESGVLRQAVYKVDPWKLGYQTSAFTQIILADPKHHRQVEHELAKIPEIVECVNIAGRYEIMVKIYATNNRHLRDIIYEKIQIIEGVEGTNTTIAFETAFDRGVPL
jgi:Lrp/AsnC family transcriptional regulator, regulator for asnA, asnC and gidA